MSSSFDRLAADIISFSRLLIQNADCWHKRLCARTHKHNRADQIEQKARVDNHVMDFN